jgi:hypothetical protein
MSGYPVSIDSLQKLAKKARKVRQADEFKAGGKATPPRKTTHPNSWSSLEAIRSARNAQLAGQFDLPVMLAESMRTDDALFTAYHNRVAPQVVVQTDIAPASGARGEAVARKARESISIPRSVLVGAAGTLVNHGIAVLHIERVPLDDGTRVDFRVTEWPLEFVRWDAAAETLVTRTRDGVTVPIRHGDGEWAIIKKFGITPWTQDACVLAAAFVWAAHSGGISDWAAGSMAHGLAKLLGELPEGVSLQSAENTLTPEAAAVLAMLQDLASGDTSAGLVSSGTKVDFLSNGSTAWQVWSELTNNREKAAARIYQGTDATLGSVGGAPGVDIATLFGVATTKLQGDFLAVEQGVTTGVLQPWTAINEGDSRYSPRWSFLVPDVDSDAKSAEVSARLERLFAAVERMKGLQMVVDQGVVDRLAAELAIDEAPKLAAAEQQAVPIALAPTDVAAVVTVREARAAQGLPPFSDGRDNLSMLEYKARVEAAAAAAGAAQ